MDTINKSILTMDRDRAEELLASMAREQIKLNQIKAFFTKPMENFTEEEQREVLVQFLESMECLKRFQILYDELIGSLS